MRSAGSVAPSSRSFGYGAEPARGPGSESGAGGDGLLACGMTERLQLLEDRCQDGL